ncbi:50S ribosomal protein L15e [Candidatus Woesearchaeota archaeon]|nr:50S ribosomal protein L15e [Candidatus Woesearchaeota archaeon]
MGMYQYVREAWKNPRESLGQVWKDRMAAWAEGPSIIRVEKPTRIDRARSLGYKAKQGYVVVRVKLLRQGRMRPKFAGGRKPKTMRRKKVLGMSFPWIAEQRAEKAFVNCTALNSYYVGETGQYMWYEVVMVDRDHPSIRADPNINWICSVHGRALRGLTSSARKSQVKKFH